MPGQNQAPNVAGMFQMINAPLSEMGNAGNQYVETFRRSMAPDVNMDDPDSLLRYADWARRNNYQQEASEYLQYGDRAKERERQTEEKLAVQRGQFQISELRNKMTSLYKDPSLSETDRTQAVNDIQRQINEIAGNTPGMIPKDYANISQNVDQYFQARKQAENAERRADASLDASLIRLGIEEEAAEMAKQRHKQLMESGALEIEAAQVNREINKLTLASSIAKGFVGQEGGKEAFLAKEGMAEYGGLYDQIEMEYETQQANLDIARANLNEARGFNYTKAELAEMLYLYPDPEKKAEELIKLGEKGLPSQAHQQLLVALQSQSATNKVPDATMLKLFDQMAQARVEAEINGTATGNITYQDNDYFGRDESSEKQTRGKINAAMLDAWLSAPNPQQGIKDIQLILSMGINPTAPSQDDTGVVANGEPTLEEIAAQLGVTVE